MIFRKFDMNLRVDVKDGGSAKNSQTPATETAPPRMSACARALDSTSSLSTSSRSSLFFTTTASASLLTRREERGLDVDPGGLDMLAEQNLRLVPKSVRVSGGEKRVLHRRMGRGC